jgi:hypothetical protein
VPPGDGWDEPTGDLKVDWDTLNPSGLAASLTAGRPRGLAVGVCRLDIGSPPRDR